MPVRCNSFTISTGFGAGGAAKPTNGAHAVAGARPLNSWSRLFTGSATITLPAQSTVRPPGSII